MERYEIGCKDIWDLYGVIVVLPYGHSYPDQSKLEDLIEDELNYLLDKMLKGGIAEYHVGHSVNIKPDKTIIMGVVADNHTIKSKGVIRCLRTKVRNMELNGRYHYPLQFKKVRSGS